MQSWGIALYERDGNHRYWFHSARKETTLADFRRWLAGINGEIIAPTFTRAWLIERMTNERIDITDILRS